MWTEEEKAKILEDCRRGRRSLCPRDNAVLKTPSSDFLQAKVFNVSCPICKDCFTASVNRSTEQFSDKDTEEYIKQHLRDLASTCPHDKTKLKVEPTPLFGAGGKTHYTVICDYCGRHGVLDF